MTTEDNTLSPDRKKGLAEGFHWQLLPVLAWSVSNRDLGQLEFFRRVLEEASDESLPLLERLKFLAVFTSNLDEFFMVRVSGLKEMLDIKDIPPMPGELSPVEQLKVIRERVLPVGGGAGENIN